MKLKKTIALTSAMVLVAGGMVFGDGVTKEIKAHRNKEMKMKVNGISEILRDDNGTALYPIIDENNRSYFPIRALGELLGVEIGWSEEERSITVNKDRVEYVISDTNENSVKKGDVVIIKLPESEDIKWDYSIVGNGVLKFDSKIIEKSTSAIDSQTYQAIYKFKALKNGVASIKMEKKDNMIVKETKNYSIKVEDKKEKIEKDKNKDSKDGKLEFEVLEGRKDSFKSAGAAVRGKTQDGYMIVVGLGERNTGGYSFKVTSVENIGGETRINIEEKRPSDNEFVTQAFTYPSLTIQVIGEINQNNLTVYDQDGKMLEPGKGDLKY